MPAHLRAAAFAALWIAGCGVPGSPGPSPSDAPVRLTAPQGLSGPVGGQLALEVESAPDAALWRVVEADRARGEIAPAGPAGAATLTLRAPGGIVVEADVEGRIARAQLAAIAVPAPAREIVPPASVQLNLPAVEASPAAVVITTQGAWEAFWRATYQDAASGEPAGSPPAVDFATRSVVAAGDTRHPSDPPPVLTHVSPGEPPTVHLVDPTILNFMVPQTAVLAISMTLFEVDRLSADAAIDHRPRAGAAPLPTP